MRVEPDPAHYAVINGRRDDPEESTPIAAGDGAAHKGAAASHGRLDGDKARLALCVAALWLAWGAHDYLQERIFRHGFHQGTFMAFSMQTSTVTLSLLHEAFRRCASSCRRRRSSVEAAPQAPVEPFTPQLWAWYALISACIALTNGMSTAALNYVSMPTKVMIKSSKVLAVMLLGTAVFGTRYETAEYGAVALLCEGLMAFSISSVGGSGSAEARAATLYGMLLLLAAVFVDSLLPNAQQLLLQQRRRPKEEVVRHTNWMSALLSLAYVASTGELGAALTFLRSRPRLALLMALQNLAGYAGVLAFLETVQRFGSKVTSIATSTRKLMTIAISSVAFRHAFSPAQLCGILAVFGGLVANSYAAQPAARILKDLTEEAENSWLGKFLPQREGFRRDRQPTAPGQMISEQPVMFTKSDDNLDPSFDFDRWEVHRSGARYGRLVLGVLFGRTTQRIAPVVFAVGTFSSLVFAYNNVFLTATQLIAVKARYPELQLPLTPFELTAPVLGLLLVFRTDTAYERFDAGAQLAWEITASMRSLMRRLAAYTSPGFFAETEREAAADLIEACCMVHSWIMTSYLRGAPVPQPTDQMQAELLRLALGEREGADGVVDDADVGGGATSVASALSSPGETTPYLWISAITLGASQRLTSLTDQERIALDDLLVTVSNDLAKCEKLISTPIPLGYTRSSVRFLWIWITLLPFALSRTFADFATNTWWEDKPLAELPVLLVAMIFISFIFLSIEDIAVQIEEPFAILPLEVQHKWLLRDAKQTRWLMQFSKRPAKRRLDRPGVDESPQRDAALSQ